MRVRTARLSIALLIATNLITGYLALRDRGEIRADHVQRVAVDGEGDGFVRIRLGVSAAPFGTIVAEPEPAADLALAPRATLQLHRELGRLLMAFEATIESEGETARSSDPAL